MAGFFPHPNHHPEFPVKKFVVLLVVASLSAAAIGCDGTKGPAAPTGTAPSKKM